MSTEVVKSIAHSTGTRTEATASKDRWYEIDFVKALSILTVILIHCNSNGLLEVQTPFEALLSDWTRFAVPTFLFCAGFLFNKDRSVSSATLGLKMARRIIPPYLFCSLIWIVYDSLKGRLSLNPFGIAQLLFFGKAHGIYYFVFVISYLYAFGLVLRYVPAHLLKWLWGLSVLAMVAYHVLWPHLVLPSFTIEAMFRSPMIHTLPFLTGWIASLHYASIRSFLSRVPAMYVALLLAADMLVLTLLQFIDIKIHPRDILIQAHIYLWLASILILAIRLHWNSRWITYLSLSSYGIYLTHILFVKLMHKVSKVFENSDLPLQVFLSCILVTAITVVFIELIKRWTGRYAELLIGVKR